MRWIGKTLETKAIQPHKTSPDDTASHPRKLECSEKFPHEGHVIVPAHTTKVYGGSRSIVPLILNLGMRCRWVASFTPRPLYSRREPLVPIVREIGWAQDPIWTVRRRHKCLYLPGFELYNAARSLVAIPTEPSCPFAGAKSWQFLWTDQQGEEDIPHCVKAWWSAEGRENKREWGTGRKTARDGVRRTASWSVRFEVGRPEYVAGGGRFCRLL